MASFRDAIASASWQVPNLMLHADVWLNDLLPFLRSHPYGSKYAELADLNEAGLRTGWLLGEEAIANKAAVVSVEHGEGTVLLIGFRAQHRAQTHGTFKLFFNALVNGRVPMGVAAAG